MGISMKQAQVRVHCSTVNTVRIVSVLNSEKSILAPLKPTLHPIQPGHPYYQGKNDLLQQLQKC